MLTFAYTARDPASGEQIKSEIQADSEQAAAKLLKEQGLSPTSLEAKEIGQSGIGKLLHRVKTKDKVIFSRQLSTLINAGLPLVQSLRSVGKQTQSKKFQAVINQVITDVEAGNAFSVALGKHPEVFSRVYVSLVAAGETSGTLDKALERIASQQEKDAEIISKVRGAMVYPVIVLLVMFAVVGFMIVKVLPQVEVLYKGLPGTQLPLITRILLAISHFTIKFWWVVLIALVIMVVFGSRWARTLGGKRIVDKFKMKAWPIGPLFMKMYMARFARTGQTLFASGVPLIQMLQVTGNSIDNYHIEASLTTAVEKVKGGKSLSDALQGDRNFLDLVPDMLHIGEQSGSMEQMLGKVADYYEREVDNQIKTISTIIEPVLMVVLGVFAFIIVAAILLPIYGLAGKSIIH
ncbi:MAG TPA: type II secretion system F family protein [Patescibacteria group bacterium]|nr:type II secretion system F family protein [Patescibacteria group bacterium]